jgi:glycerol kinase
MDCLLAIDQGTTGTTALVLDRTFRVLGRATKDFRQIYPAKGWVEHSLDDIWQSVGTAVKAALANAQQLSADFSTKNIAAIGITNQRETLCIFDRATGKQLRNAIVWQCKRSQDICDRLRKRKVDITNATGLVLDPYFSGTKLTWVLENEPEVASALRKGSAVWGNIDTYLLYRLTGGAAYATEASNASRTLLLDLNKGSWSSELAAAIDVGSLPSSPEVLPSFGAFGKTKGCDFLPDGIPITGILGDQQAALLGQACIKPGQAKCTYGTGAFLLMNIGEKVQHSKSGLLTTIAWSEKGKLTYAFEGSAFIAGAAVQFLRDNLGFFAKSSECEPLARSERAAPDIYFVPSLSGLGAPYWDSRARGAFLGLTRDTTKGQMTRAVLESLALQVVDLVQSMEVDSGQVTSELAVDGGAAANNLLMELQAGFGGFTVRRPTNLESTAVGAAAAAALGVGIFRTIGDIANLAKGAETFRADLNPAVRQAALKGWSRAIEAVRVFARE